MELKMNMMPLLPAHPGKPDLKHPVAVIGGGPIGLAAGAHLISRGLAVRVYEAGDTVGAGVRDWGHVRTFSPWRYSIDSASRALLERTGWTEPPANGMPTGGDLYWHYLEPLAGTAEMQAVIETSARVVAVTRKGMDKIATRGRAERPFDLVIQRRDGSLRHDLASAVIDASGTWTNPNPLGANGLPAEGEGAHREQIAYGIPDVLGRDRARYSEKTVLVVGAGHSAANALLDLVKLAREHPATRAIWAVRGANPIRVFGGGEADQLPARGELGADIQALVDSNQVELVTGFAISAVRHKHDRLFVEGEGADGVRVIGPVDRIIAATGQRPDLELTRELRLQLDPWLESAQALGPLIDPNEHSCGSVPPHGHRELSHPEPGFYTVGIKSYGRAPTFLLLTGYEQVRSVVAAIAGDMAAADNVQLVLPETGVCSIDLVGDGCCGGPAAGEDACCVADEAAKASGEAGCGCGASREPSPKQNACCGVAA